MEIRPRLVITGASGFVARHLMRALKARYRLVALDRHPRIDSQIPREAEVVWHQVDLGEARQVESVFQRIAAGGGADALIHLAAHYDFTGEEHPEYWRTNVDALRHVLEGSRALGVRFFVFASSLAACAFPPPGSAVTEDSAADGAHIYARTKRVGEAMLAEYQDSFRSVIVRFAALFSDWCEYLPLYHFFGTWLSGRWNASFLAGRGESAIPYLHVRDAALFLAAVLERADVLRQGEVLAAAVDRPVSHRELYEVATHELFGRAPKPWCVPKSLCVPGVWMLDLIGQHFGERPFERPWMAQYIDQKLTVETSRSRERLGWEPRRRLEILRRIPFLVENFKTDPIEWHRRNQEILMLRRPLANLRIYQLLQDHRQEIVCRSAELLHRPEVRDRLPHDQDLSTEELEWSHRLALRNLLHAVRTRRKGLFMAYCRDLAERRAELGYRVAEVAYSLHALRQACHEVLDAEPEVDELRDELRRLVNQTIRFGVDQVQMVYEALEGRASELPTTETLTVERSATADV